MNNESIFQMIIDRTKAINEGNFAEVAEIDNKIRWINFQRMKKEGVI